MDKTPMVDAADDGACFPSPYSLTKYMTSETDFDGSTFKTPYRRGQRKAIMIAPHEQYLLMGNGRLFSTGISHWKYSCRCPVPVKLKLCAMPKEHKVVQSVYQKYLPKLKQPQKLGNLLKARIHLTLLCSFPAVTGHFQEFPTVPT